MFAGAEVWHWIGRRKLEVQCGRSHRETTPRAELRESGMSLILGGLLVTIVAMVSALTSGLNLPSWFYSLSIVVIPLAMALAVRKQARLGEAG